MLSSSSLRVHEADKSHCQLGSKASLSSLPLLYDSTPSHTWKTFPIKSTKNSLTFCECNTSPIFINTSPSFRGLIEPDYSLQAFFCFSNPKLEVSESKLAPSVPVWVQTSKYLLRYCTKINSPVCKLHWLLCKTVSSKQLIHSSHPPYGVQTDSILLVSG